VCARGDGIRGSKDLRAEIGKFPNSTNERKQMSIKTLKKRIAVVAVSALTAGVLSVMSAPASNAAVIGTSYNWGTAAGTAYTTATAGVCSQNSTTDVLEVRQGRFDYTTGAVLRPSAAGLETDSTTQYYYFTATGTGYWNQADSAADTTEAKIDRSADEKTLTIGDTTTAADLDVLDVVPWVQTAAGTTTINLYEVVISTGAQTLLETFTLRAVTECTPSAASLTYSAAQLQTTATALTTYTGAADVSAAVTVEYATGVSYLATFTLDALANAVSDTDSYLTAKSTGGCTLSWAAGDLSSTRTSVVATSGIYNEVLKIFTAGTAANTCTVTVDYNGTVLATKTVSFRGEAASVVSVSPDYAIPDTSVAAGYYDVLDSAGNRLAGFAPSATNLTGALAGAAITFEASTGTSTRGAVTINAVDNQRGVGTYQIKATKSDGSTITSAPISMLVSGGMSTYALSLDKASYTPGEIITVTVSAKDSGGRIVPDGTALGGTVSFTIAGASVLGSAPVAGDAAENGVWTYKYTAGIITGNWAANFSSTSSATETAKQVTYSIKSNSTEVSNAEVLKSIVALIASINKQIQALQKLILKR
jgi:hypothetical protein